MAQTHEWMFYELMWRARARGEVLPLPWWVQQYFRYWLDSYDGGLFSSKEAAFASNAHYRYWNMVGVKDHHQESLVGQAGEIEPVYDQYALSFFLFDPLARRLYLPQFPDAQGGASPLQQELEAGYLPVVVTTYRSPLGIEVEEKVIATTIGMRQRSVVLARFTARLAGGAAPRQVWLCITVSPAGPTGFERHDKAGRYSGDKRLTFLRYVTGEQRVEINARIGPLFGSAPAFFGLYGNEGSSYDPELYLNNSPYQDLILHGGLNGHAETTDRVAGICTGVFAWPLDLTPANATFRVHVKLPVDDYRGDDIAELRAADPEPLEQNNRAYWTQKLDRDGFQAELPPTVRHLFDLFRTCRANLLILADQGQIHPGPTIYDSFWVRDSSVEGIACALGGDFGLPEQQFGQHYRDIFNYGYERWGPVSLHGFFGGEHEKNDWEWDANGQALWAIGRLDRIFSPFKGFGKGLFVPYLLEGARWLRDNRSAYGLLHHGWSAEHIGDKDKPHYWDDFWGLAGLWETARLAERIGAWETGEIWSIYDDLRRATRDSIRWVLTEQARRGFWETFIPTGPADVGRLDSTIIGTLAYFHPCRLYMGAKLDPDIDLAARMTLETIWHHFMDGGFRHDSAWNCYGPYLTLQLAHAFLLIGDVARMDQCLAWSVNAGLTRIGRQRGNPADQWQVVLGAWNEQHCYPIAKDFAEIPGRWWYMGDIPHGWACAEFILLLRDILFFEADEDGTPHIYLAPGVLPHWLGDGQSIRVSNAPTTFGGMFGFTLTHRQSAKTVDIQITQRPPGTVSYVYPCRFGTGVGSASADGNPLPVSGIHVWLPPGTQGASITYR